MLNRPQEENNTAELECKEVKLDKLYLDVEFLSDPKLQYLILEHGATAGMVVVAAWALIARTTGAKLPRKHLKTLAAQLRMEPQEVDKIIGLAIDEKLLYVENDLVTHKRIVDAQRKLALDRAKFRDRQNKKRETNNFSVSVPRDTHVTPQKALTQPQHSTSILNTQDQPQGLGGCGREGAELPPKPKPPPKTVEPPSSKQDFPKFYQEALEFLVPEDDPILSTNGINSVTGRRPMRNFPQIWVTPIELADAIEICMDSGVPEGKINYVFKFVQSKIKTAVSKGQRAENICAYSWLTGFGLEQTQKVLKAGKDLERSGEYLEKSRAA